MHAVQGQSLERLLESLRRNFGPEIMGALDDPTVSDIALNPDGRVWIKRVGQGKVFSGVVIDAGVAGLILTGIASILGVIVDQSESVLEGELPLDGSRFEGMMPPLVAAPSFSIRKKASKIYTLNDFIHQKLMTVSQVRVIQEAIAAGRNILVIGGTGSGKTTVLNAFLEYTARACPHIRMVIIEDTVELQCAIEDKVQLRTSLTKDMTALLRVTMRLDPDRICVGEVRGKEGLALLKAWNSGHSGGFATIHADSVADGLTKLDEYIQEAGVGSKMRLISRAVHVVVYIEVDEHGRRVREVGRVTGYDREKDEPIIEQVG